ncbi:hypothetical protein BZG36_05366, partial [Bifiguratus adelaidae]
GILTTTVVDSSKQFEKLLPEKWVEKKRTATSIELPECCPLIYPTVPLDEQGGSNFFKTASKFVQDYGDRCGAYRYDLSMLRCYFVYDDDTAPQQYIDQNPDSHLAGPAPEFLTKRGQPQTGWKSS